MIHERGRSFIQMMANPIAHWARERHNIAAAGVVRAPLASTLGRILRGLLAYIFVLGNVSFAQAASTCSAPAEGSAAYAHATDAVRQLSEFRAWSKSHFFPIAFGTPNDKEVLIRRQCYWIVSVYADRPERLELWRVFYVRLPSKAILVQDFDGSPISLSAWRTQSKIPGQEP